MKLVFFFEESCGRNCTDDGITLFNFDGVEVLGARLDETLVSFLRLGVLTGLGSLGVSLVVSSVLALADVRIAYLVVGIVQMME